MRKMSVFNMIKFCRRIPTRPLRTRARSRLKSFSTHGALPVKYRTFLNGVFFTSRHPSVDTPAQGRNPLYYTWCLIVGEARRAETNFLFLVFGGVPALLFTWRRHWNHDRENHQNMVLTVSVINDVHDSTVRFNKDRNWRTKKGVLTHRHNVSTPEKWLLLFRKKKIKFLNRYPQIECPLKSL